MEYGPLTWNGSPINHLRRLDGIRNKAQQLFNWKCKSETSPVVLQKLQNRGDLSALCVFYKVHKMWVDHLQSIQGTKTTPLNRNLKRWGRRQEEISVPRSRTEQHLRSFVPNYASMWKNLVQETSLISLRSLQVFKSQTHHWLNRTDFLVGSYVFIMCLLTFNVCFEYTIY